MAPRFGRRTTIPQFLRSVKRDLKRGIGLFPVFILTSLPVLWLLVPRTAAAITVVAVITWRTPLMKPVRDFIRKQLNWFVKLSKQGPVFWLFGLFGRVGTSVLRRGLGPAVERLPAAPLALGPTKVGINSVNLKWLPAPTGLAGISPQKFKLQVQVEGEWTDLLAATDNTTFNHGGLKSGEVYLYRVSAFNSKGSSSWVEKEVRCKLVPKDGGGAGEGYTWIQDRDTVTLSLPLPAEVKGKELSVVAGAKLTVKLRGDVILAGELAGDTVSDELEWELEDSASNRLLVITLFKSKDADLPMRPPPTWKSAIKGHPEIDVSMVPKPKPLAGMSM